MLYYWGITIQTCPYLCGDGILETGEVCDNNFYLGTNGCNSTCNGVSSGWYCYNTSSSPASLCSTICGDGMVAGTETCDDGKIDGMGCLNTCNGVYVGWYCSGGTSTTPSVCNT